MRDKDMSRGFGKAISVAEHHLKMKFPEIIERHFKKGWSRYQCCDYLNALAEKEQWPEVIEYLSTTNKPFFKQATVWNAVKDGIRWGLIQNFDFRGRSKDNENYVQKHPRKRSGVSVPKALPSDMPERIEATYTCLNCGNKKKSSFKVKDAELEQTMLRVRPCPACHEYATCKMDFEFQGIKATKAVIIYDDIRQEYFVDEKLQKIENPFTISVKKES